jgi:hypothetical protein
MKTLIASLALTLAVTGAAAQTPPPAAGERTIVNDRAALARLRRNSGITLQWISFGQPGRGHVTVTERNGLIHLRGSQTQNRGAGRVDLDGDVLSIGPRSFTFRGRISIENSPDQDRECPRDRHAPLLAASEYRGLRRPRGLCGRLFLTRSVILAKAGIQLLFHSQKRKSGIPAFAE